MDEYDLRHGGRYRFVHVDTDGTEYAFRGVFHSEPSVEEGNAKLDALLAEELAAASGV